MHATPREATPGRPAASARGTPATPSSPPPMARPARPPAARRCLFLPALVAAALAPAAVQAAPRDASGPETLVPANMQPQTDAKGNQWSLNNYGFLQNTGNSFFNNILMLHVGGQQFYNYQPMMTADGKEFVLPGQQPVMGLQVTRRIRLLEKDGLMRYVDLFHNPGPSLVNATVEYRNNFSTPLKGSVTDRGTVNPATLAKGESGLLVTSKQNTQKACALILGAPGAKLRPSITTRGQYETHFSYALTVPPGQTVALACAVGLATPPPDGDKAALAKLFKSMPASAFLKTIRREDLALLANFAAAGGGAPSALLALQGLESLDVERTTTDVLAIGAKTRLTGSASGGAFKVTTAHGAAAVPFDQVAALVGGARAGGGIRVFLRDGQVLAGTAAEAANFRFAMPSGAHVDLELGTLDRLVRRAAPDEGRWPPETVALLVTHQGEHLALTSGPVLLEAATAWGPLAFSLDDVAWLGPLDETGPGQQIEFRDGSRFHALLSGAPVTLPTRLFGPRAFLPSEIRGLVTAAALAAPRTDVAAAGATGQPYLVLAGGQRLAGQLETETLTVLTGAKAIQVPPGGLRSLRNALDESGDADPMVEADSPPFQIDLWGGGTILGQLRDPVLPVRFRQARWSVPVADILELHNPAPQVSDEVRLKIAGLIRSLGSDDWQTRESATEELATFGFLARPLLDEALNSTPDPEVRRRAEQLIGDIE